MTAEELERAGEELAKQNERAQRTALAEATPTAGHTVICVRARARDPERRCGALGLGLGRGGNRPRHLWEDLGIDCLLLDEAQNMKNLWPVPRARADNPEVSGGNRGTSAERWSLRSAPSWFVSGRAARGVSAVRDPGQNSPLEYFSLLSLVDGEAWTRLGIPQTRRLHRSIPKNRSDGVMDTDLKRRFREVVVGFMNLDELREIIFHFAEFRTAEEVGLKLPKVEPRRSRCRWGASGLPQAVD